MCYNHNNQNFILRGEKHEEKFIICQNSGTLDGYCNNHPNEQEIKTSQMTREVEFLFREREERFYKSPDPLVRGFANLPGLIKALVVILMIALVAVIGYIWIYIPLYIYRWKKRRRRRCRRN